MGYSYDIDMSQPTLRDFPSTLSAKERSYFGSNDTARANAGGDWTKGAAFLGSFLSKLGGDDKDKYRKQAEYGGPRSLGGDRNYFDSGSFGKIGEDITMYVPPQTPQQAPVFIPGSGPTGPSTGQRLARAGGGALSGAAAGAALGPIGMAGGALLGGLGGFFG